MRAVFYCALVCRIDNRIISKRSFLGMKPIGRVKPKLVAEIAFAEFTSDARARHASFIAMREDKSAKTVVPERAQTIVPDAAVDISSRERVIFPGSGQTKGDLADYYKEVAGLILPFAANRPISLVRCPQGRSGRCFFQKHDSGMLGDHVRHVAVPIAWDELQDLKAAHPLNITKGQELIGRAQSKKLAGWGFADQTLPDI